MAKLNLEQNPFESDVQYFKRLAKAADQRLVRLERLAADPEYKNVLSYAYKNAMYDIKRAARSEFATRFNRMPVKTKAGAADQRSLHANINAVKRFLESASSTKSGINKVYKKRADTINSKYGTNFTWQELAKFFDQQSTAISDSKYGSKTILRAVAAIQNADQDTIKAIKEGNEREFRLSDNDEINKVAFELLRKN